MIKNDELQTIDNAALEDVTGGWAGIARLAGAAGRGISKAWTAGSKFLGDAAKWIGGAEVGSRAAEHATGQQIPRPSDLMGPRAPAAPAGGGE
jgi:hypothetical protein